VENFFDLLGLDSVRERQSAPKRSAAPLTHEPEDIELTGLCPGGSYVYLAGEALRLFLLRLLAHDGPMALDIETGGLLPHTSSIFLVSVSTKPHTAGVFDFRTAPMDLVRRVLCEKEFIIHNACFELAFLAHHTGIMPRCSFDTMVARQLVTAGDRSRGASLAECLRDYFGLEVEKGVRSIFPKLSPDSPLTNEEIVYAAGDVTLLLPLADALQLELDELELSSVYWELEHPLLPIVAEHQLRGVKVDLDHLKACEAKYAEAVERCSREIELTAPGLVWTSNAALLRHLREEGLALQNVDRAALEDALRSTARERARVNIDDLRQRAQDDPAAAKKLAAVEEKLPVLKLMRLVLEARGYAKMLSTYIRPLLHEGPHQTAGIIEPAVKGGVLNPVTRKIHPSFRTLGTETGRFSCSDPNLQNIPQEQEFRSIFICEDDEVVITSDYSQFEVRYLAEISGEERMIKMFRALRLIRKSRSFVLRWESLGILTAG